MKAEQQHRYHRAASHASIQQSGASSGLDRATGSATTTTDNPQDRSPCSKHWLDAAPTQSFQAVGVRNADPKRAKKAYNNQSEREEGWSWKLSDHRGRKCCVSDFSSMSQPVVVSVAWSRSLTLCSCSLALQQHSNELYSDVIAQPQSAPGRGRAAEARCLILNAPRLQYGGP